MWKIKWTAFWIIWFGIFSWKATMWWMHYMTKANNNKLTVLEINWDSTLSKVKKIYTEKIQKWCCCRKTLFISLKRVKIIINLKLFVTYASLLKIRIVFVRLLWQIKLGIFGCICSEFFVWLTCILPFEKRFLLTKMAASKKQHCDHMIWMYLNGTKFYLFSDEWQCPHYILWPIWFFLLTHFKKGSPHSLSSNLIPINCSEVK